MMTAPSTKNSGVALRNLTCTLLGLVLAWACLACGPHTQRREALALSGGGNKLEVPLPEGETWVSMCVLDGTLFLLGQSVDTALMSTSKRTLLALDPKSGSVRWQSEFQLPSGGAAIYANDIIAAPNLVIYRADYVFMGLSPKDGAVRWTIDTQMASARFVGATEQSLFLIEHPALLKSYDLATGQERQRWNLSAQVSMVSEAWLSTNAKALTFLGDPGSGGMGEVAAFHLDLENQSATAEELFRLAYTYDAQMGVVAPIHFNVNGSPTYGPSDLLGRVSTDYTQSKVEVWSAAAKAPIIERTFSLQNNDYYSSAYYAPRLFMPGNVVVLQEPSVDGILLRKVLRLHFVTVQGEQQQEWTTVLPTMDYIDATLQSGGLLLLHTRNDMTYAERWYAVDTAAKRVLWANRDEDLSGQTRAITADGRRLFLLTTTNWSDSRLSIHTLSP